MPIQKSKTLASGITGNYWKIIDIRVNVLALTTSFVIALYKDSSQTTSIRGTSRIYNFNLSSEAEIFAGTIADAYVAILAKAASEVINLNGVGTHIYDPDLAGGTIVG